MYLTHLNLSEFRSVRSLDLAIPPEGFGLVGANAAGKSTIFEAIILLATTRSTRAGVERELLNWKSGEDLQVAPYARVEGTFSSIRGTRTIEIGFQAEPLHSTRVRKVVSLDGKRTTAGRVVGALKCVLFEPQDIDLIAGSPGQRRRFLDVMLSQVDHGYLTALSRYGRIVEQRNSLIKRLVREGMSWQDPAVRTELDYWDNELIAHGARIIHRRVKAIDDLDRFARDRFAAFTGIDSMTTSYQPSLGSPTPDETRISQFIRSARDGESGAAFAMAEQLKHVRGLEFKRSVTLIGPHRDDLTVQVEGIDIGTFGSRGQQRLAAVALKLAEADLMFAEGGDQPIVLLDDVYSELDRNHRAQLSASIGDLGAQVIVSATEHATLQESGLSLAAIGTIQSGEFSWVAE
ncbi:MAG: DNA replication/repair protein RecF [Thermomicrobiales bacterium]|nr:DNA replication/repair protein RecF [Thermomicrobiales bacterium]